MKKIALVSTLFIAIIATVVVGCSKPKKDENNTGNSYDRGALLSNYADGYIMPAYADMVSKLTTLKTAVDAFTTAPDTDKLLATRAAWKDAYIAWQAVDLLEFGPEASISLRSYINIYPVTITKVNGNIASGSYDLEQFGNKDAQGFPALDYLLRGIGATDDAVVSAYTTDAQAANRKVYLQKIAEKMLTKVTSVQTAWNSYKTSFVANTSTDAGSSISVMTNAFVLYYERYLRSGKIGLPVGAMTGVAAPELIEAYYTPSISKELAVAAMTSVNNFYEGKSYNGVANGIGFKDYLTAVGTKDDNGKLIAEVITDQLGLATAALQALNTPIYVAVVRDRPTVLDIYQKMMNVVPLLKVDMVSAFGISITYTDNDGD